MYDLHRSFMTASIFLTFRYVPKCSFEFVIGKNYIYMRKKGENADLYYFLPPYLANHNGNPQMTNLVN